MRHAGLIASVSCAIVGWVFGFGSVYFTQGLHGVRWNGTSRYELRTEWFKDEMEAVR